MPGPETQQVAPPPVGNEGIAARPVISRAAMTLLLLAIAGVMLAPIWTVRYPLLVDYPNHLASAFVLAHLRDAAFNFGQYYRSNWNTYPYLSMDVILLGLQHVFPIEITGRLFLSLCVLSVPAGAWVFVRKANPGEQSLAFWSLLVTHNLYFFRFGFLNLQLSMAVCFLLLGMWLWHLERQRLSSWILLVVVATALYFTHLVGFAVAAVAMTAYGLSARRKLKDMVAAWALYLPGALFYLHSMVGHGARGGVHFLSLPRKIGNVIAVMISCSPAIDLLTIAVLFGVFAWAQIDNREFHWNRHWWRATAILFVLYLVLPSVIGPATNVDKRLLPFVFVMSLASAGVGRRGRQLAIVAVLVFCIRTGAVERNFISGQAHFASLAGAASSIPAGSRVLPIVDWADGASWPERHFWAYGVIDRGWVSPCLYHDPGVHPFALKDDPYDPCLLSITPATALDWNRVGKEFDYVWVYHLPEFTPALSSRGKQVFAGDNLQVFQMSKLAESEKPVVAPPSP